MAKYEENRYSVDWSSRTSTGKVLYLEYGQLAENSNYENSAKPNGGLVQQTE